MNLQKHSSTPQIPLMINKFSVYTNNHYKTMRKDMASYYQ